MVLADDFKKMYKQKFKEMEKAYEKQVSWIHSVCAGCHCVCVCWVPSELAPTHPLQEKLLRQMKSHGQSKKHAVSFDSP